MTNYVVIFDNLLLINLLTEHHFFIIFNNSEVHGLELVENFEEMVHMDSDVISRFKSSTTHWRVTRYERFN